MRIELKIERLVLHGVSTADENAIRSAVEEQLAEALTAADPAQLGARTIGTVAATMSSPADGGPQAWGTAVGATVAGALIEPGRS